MPNPTNFRALAYLVGARVSVRPVPVSDAPTDSLVVSDSPGISDTPTASPRGPNVRSHAAA